LQAGNASTCLGVGDATEGKGMSDTEVAGLRAVEALAAHVPNWRAMLRLGGEAGQLAGDGLAIAEAIETRLRTGRLLGTQEWIARQEQALARKLTPAKRGPKPQPRIQPDT
jgi:hypothetical protein